MFLMVMGLFSLCACAVGPDYQPPDFPLPKAWHADLPAGLQTGPMEPATMSQWWRNLQDPLLSDLIRQTLDSNLDLKEAQARVREARARRGISTADQFPTLDASASFTQSRSHQQTGELYRAGFDASWELDIFGGRQRSLQAAQADMEAFEEERHATMVSITAETVLNYLDVRAFQSRLTAAGTNLQIQQETLDLSKARYQAGLGNELAVQQARYNLENTRAQIPSLKIGLEAALNRLAVMTGQAPGSLHARLGPPGSIPVPDLTLAMGLPAEALRNRPDIRKAERLLAAQSARIGVAEAELYPKFRLGGTIGLEATRFSDWFEPFGRFWNYGPAVSWRIFDASAVRQNIEVQSALQEQALIRYEAAVLSALTEVESALTAFAQEQVRREALALAVEAAQAAVRISQDQYKAGLVDFSAVLDAQRSLLSFQDQLVQSNAAVTSNWVRLYKTMGGGWTSSSPPAKPPAQSKKDFIP